MAMSGANYDIHFQNLGKIIKLYNVVQADIDAIRAIEEEYAVLANDTEDETTSLRDLLVVTRSMASTLRATKTQIAAVAQAYIRAGLRKGIGYTGSSTNLIDILEDLTEDMVEASETCDGSVVAYANLTYDPDNAGTGLLAAPSNLSQLLTDEAFEMECNSIAAGAGAETWEVRGEPDEGVVRKRHGVLATALTTGESYLAVDRNLQALFTLLLTAYAADTGYELAGDVDGELATYTFSGAVKATNTDTAGDVYIDLDRLTAVEAGDGDNQLSGWDSITGLELAKNTDAAGKLHAKFIKENGTAYVELYRDADLAAGNKVGHTDSGGTGARSITADNSSGLGGTITVDAITASDDSITYTYAFDRVRAYKESGKTNLVCTGGKVAGGATNLYEQNSSALSGTVVVAYNDGEADVQVRVGFAFAVGDKIRFDTTSDEAGTFIEFFRKELGVAPAVNLAGGETVDDAWAE